jgi:ech hydrogenase subunit F
MRREVKKMGFFEISKTIIRSALSKPATLMYPAKPAKKFGISRGHVVNDINKCIFCGSCQRKCPTKAICVNLKERTWEIDKFRCVVCNVCVEVCPVKSLSMDSQYTAPAEKKSRELMKGPPKAPKPDKKEG